MRPIIQARGVSKRYRVGGGPNVNPTLRETIVDALRRPLSRRGARGGGDLLWALRDVSFEAEAGEVVGIVGRNGAGKSSLLKILSRVIRPTAGEVDIYGRVGSLLEMGTGFHPDLTGAENIYLNGALIGMRREEVRRKFDEIVAFAGVERFLRTPVKRYSSGMYLRLAFAVAAHFEPEVLILDEVLAVGDAAFQRKCLDKMDEISRAGRTVLFVSHDLLAVQRLCGRVLLIEGGRLVEEGDPFTISASYVRLLAEAEERAAAAVGPA